MNQENDISRRAYIMYNFDCNVSIDMYCNPDTEIQIKKSAKLVYKFEFDPSVYIFAVDLPDQGFLREKNQVVYEIFYSPNLLSVANFYSNRYAFNTTDTIENYFMIGFKFNKNESNMHYTEPPGKPINNQIQEFCYFFYYIMNSYCSTFEKMVSQKMEDRLHILSNHSLTQLQDNIEIFKLVNQNLLISNPKSITDYLAYLDDFIQTVMMNKEKKEVILMMVAMFGIFP